MLPSERREFVRTHRTCVYGYRRRHDGPAHSRSCSTYPPMTTNCWFSTMAPRGKARAVARDPKVSLCVLDERWPFVYLQVYADAVIDRDRDLAVDGEMMAVAGTHVGTTRSVTRPAPYVAQMADKEDRVVVRCRPYASFAQPPRQLHRNDQVEEVTHWVAPMVPWDTPDPV